CRRRGARRLPGPAPGQPGRGATEHRPAVRAQRAAPEVGGGRPGPAARRRPGPKPPGTPDPGQPSHPPPPPPLPPPPRPPHAPPRPAGGWAFRPGDICAFVNGGALAEMVQSGQDQFLLLRTQQTPKAVAEPQVHTSYQQSVRFLLGQGKALAEATQEAAREQ